MQFLTFATVSLSLLTPILALPQAASSSATPAPSASPAPAPNPAGLSFIQQLELAPVAADRIALLKDEDFVFDFQAHMAGAPGVASGKGGRTVNANRKTFPALIGSGGSVTIGFLGPCGFNTPHVHPRATELNLVVQGTLVTNFVAENNVRKVANTVHQYQMTVFPQGAIHEEFNPDCTDTVFVAAFPNEDPATNQIADNFFKLDDEVIQAALKVESIDGAEIEKFRMLIPPNVAEGVEACLKKCNIPKK